MPLAKKAQFLVVPLKNSDPKQAPFLIKMGASTHSKLMLFLSLACIKRK